MTLGPRIEEDPFLEIFGLKKAVRKGSPQTTVGPNSKLERYVMNQQRYLWKLQRRGRTDLFWKTAERLLRSSKAFRLLALRNVKPNWYKDTEWKKVQQWMIELNHICYRPPETYEINRSNIPKKDGGIRYINDPGVPWRCYLWMWNLMLHYFVNPLLNENQHGHRAGRLRRPCVMPRRRYAPPGLRINFWGRTRGPISNRLRLGCPRPDPSSKSRFLIWTHFSTGWVHPALKGTGRPPREINYLHYN